MKTFNFYCDESCHLENDGKPFMLIGYICVPYNQITEHKERINALRKRHNYFNEIKWVNISGRVYKFYYELLKYFFISDMTFRSIVVDKNQIKNKAFSQDFDTFHYKMYYQLIHHKIDMNNRKYNVYLDYRDSLSTIRVRKLREILQTKYSVIQKVQSVNSKESVFIQLSDLILGAISYNLRELRTNQHKLNLINFIKKGSDLPLNCSTSLSEDKFNLFFIELK